MADGTTMRSKPRTTAGVSPPVAQTLGIGTSPEEMAAASDDDLLSVLQHKVGCPSFGTRPGDEVDRDEPEYAGIGSRVEIIRDTTNLGRPYAVVRCGDCGQQYPPG